MRGAAVDLGPLNAASAVQVLVSGERVSVRVVDKVGERPELKNLLKTARFARLLKGALNGGEPALRRPRQRLVKRTPAEVVMQIHQQQKTGAVHRLKRVVGGERTGRVAEIVAEIVRVKPPIDRPFGEGGAPLFEPALVDATAALTPVGEMVELMRDKRVQADGAVVAQGEHIQRDHLGARCCSGAADRS